MAVQTRPPPTRKPPTARKPLAAQPPASRGITRRWASVFVAAAIVVAGTSTVTVRTLAGRTVTTAGTVLDARTDKPVSGVVVAPQDAADARQTTDANGHFRILEVRRGARLEFSAPNYNSATASAEAKALRVELRPIPVAGSVTSIFTGKGIAATVSGKEKHATQSDGTFRTFGVGPGDELKVSAFGHEGASVKIDKSRRVQIALKLGRIDPALVLTPKAGYGFVDVPKEFIEEMRAEIAYSDPDFNRYLTGISAKTVVHNGQTVAFASVMAIEPGVATLPGVAEGFYRGVAEGGGATVETIMIGQTPAKKMRSADGWLGYAWQEYASFAFVVGEKPELVEAFVKTQILGETAST